MPLASSSGFQTQLQDKGPGAEQEASEEAAAGASPWDFSRQSCNQRPLGALKTVPGDRNDPGNPARAAFLWDQEFQSYFRGPNQSLKKSKTKQTPALLIQVAERVEQVGTTDLTPQGISCPGLVPVGAIH